MLWPTKNLSEKQDSIVYKIKKLFASLLSNTKGKKDLVSGSQFKNTEK